MNLDLIECNRRATGALLGAILSATCLGAFAASFDCAKARSKSERLICGDPKLSALDDRLAALAAAGKKRASNPRAYQRALDAAWSVRQKCEDIACVESWYGRRIEALSNAEPQLDTSAERPPAKEPPRAPATSARPEVAAQAPAPEPALAKTNVIPGAQLQVIGEELGFRIPLTREEFLSRYDASGGQCGVSQHLSSLKALSRSVESDCWTGPECPAPAAGLSCKMLRTAYDRTGRLVLFAATLSTVDAKRAEGARSMDRLVDKFAELGGSETRIRGLANGRALSTSGSQGQFRLDAEVAAAEGGKQIGTFSVAAR